MFVATTGVLVSSTQQSEAADRGRALDSELVQIAIKLYDLEMQVPTLYMKANIAEGGEGLFARLFNDPIAVLELALSRNDKNVVARFYLAKAYFAKSDHGEGRWSRLLLDKAEDQFGRVISATATTKVVQRQMLVDARQAIDDIKKIRAGHGDLID